MSFLQNWPAFRTARSVPPKVWRRALLIGSGVSLLAPIVLAIILGLAANLLKRLGLADVADVFEPFAVFMWATLLGIVPSLIPAILVARVAIKTGYAGWACALLSGGIIAFLFFEYVMEIKPEGMPVGVGFGLGFGALFWGSARLSTPAAFVVTKTSKDDM